MPIRFVLLSFLLPLCLSAQFFSAGVKAGYPLSYSAMNVTNTPPNFCACPVTWSSPSRQYIVGGMAEVKLPFHFSVEADVLYHPFDLQFTYTPSRHFLVDDQTSSVLEFPVVAKYRLGTRKIAPYVEGGLSLRTKPDSLANFVASVSGMAGNVSPIGETFGAGLEFKALFLKISPEFRYTHWQRGSLNANNPSIEQLNQAAFLLSFSF